MRVRTLSLSDYSPTYLSISERDDIVIVAFRVAELSDEENIELMGTELLDLVDQFDCRKIIVDLANIRMLTSSAMGKLITLHRKLHRCDGSLVICGLAGDPEMVFRTSNLLNYFQVTDDVDGAIEVLIQSS